MKILITVLLFLASFVFIEISMAQSPMQVPSPVAAVAVPPSPVIDLGFIGFVKANLAVIAGLVYFLIDLVIAVHPALEANGLLHAVLLWAGKLSSQNPPSGS